MIKFLYLWILCLLLLLVAALVQRGSVLVSGMLFIYDAHDTSLWDVDVENAEAHLFFDFDAPALSVMPIAFRVDRQSLIYLRLPLSSERGTVPFEIIERDMQTGVELKVLSAQWIFALPLARREALFVRIVEDAEQQACILAFMTNQCYPISANQLVFFDNSSLIWASNGDYALKQDELYYFDSAAREETLILQDAWSSPLAAAYDTERQSLYIAAHSPESSHGLCRSSQFLQFDVATMDLERLAIDIADCNVNFSELLLSPNGRYLQYNLRKVFVIDLETESLMYVSPWFAEQALWANDKALLYTEYQQFASSLGRSFLVNIETGESRLVHEGMAGYVFLYRLP